MYVYLFPVWCSFFPREMVKYTKKLSGAGIEPQYDPSTYKTDWGSPPGAATGALGQDIRLNQTENEDNPSIRVHPIYFCNKM